ncbi:MAG: hypothetical protein H7Y11_04800 [Armatimonadetes bacterium]|nr:hypothetical protein [Anaerolineae bacterium]
MEPVIRQRYWTEPELRTQGFNYYPRIKQLVMAGRLQPAQAPLKIAYEVEVITAEAGDVLIFDPGTLRHQRMQEYNYWSVKPTIFKQTYRKWDDNAWSPNAPQAHLMQHGCRPYYKQAGVWARLLTKPTPVQSLESHTPVLIPKGMWVAVGSQGEPWHIEDSDFRSRYLVTVAAPPERV